MLSLHTQGLGKAYKVHRRPIDSLKEALLRRSLSEPVWAVQDVDLDLEAGGSIGIIGENGAGKSTLLRLLAGVTRPSCGVVTHVGRVGTMLQLGAGFHPDLPGTENVRIGCAVMGLSPRETDALLPAIIDFAELGDFIHRPLRTYSSGMTLRLGFAVAVAQRPDLLVVDEHLSVGDLHFRYKCLRRIAELRESGCALVLCSHDFHSVRETCDRTLWLHQGRPRMLADTASVPVRQHFPRQSSIVIRRTTGYRWSSSTATNGIASSTMVDAWRLRSRPT
jgi:lipopolysaccharide transport system ATP-binding protein